MFHAGWSTPVGVVLVVLCAGFAAALPALLTGDDLVAGLVMELLLLVWLALSALVVAAARNERLLLAADGRIEATGAGGPHPHRRTTRSCQPARNTAGHPTISATPKGGRCARLRRMPVNCKPLLARLQQRGIGFATPHDQARASRFPLPKVRATLDWDEADRTPAHRWLPLLRRGVGAGRGADGRHSWLLTRSAGRAGIGRRTAAERLPPWCFTCFTCCSRRSMCWDYFPQRPARQAMEPGAGYPGLAAAPPPR